MLDGTEPRRAIAAVRVVPLGCKRAQVYVYTHRPVLKIYEEVVAMRDQTAESVRVAILNWWVSRHAVMNTLLTDQGRNVDGE